jgi:transcriptional regulator with XRE-family HTH domain
MKTGNFIFPRYIKGGENIKIKAIREKRGLTQKQLADRLGVKQQNISDWERGERSPSVKNLKKLAEVLNCQIDDLV